MCHVNLMIYSCFVAVRCLLVWSWMHWHFLRIDFIPDALSRTGTVPILTRSTDWQRWQTQFIKKVSPSTDQPLWLSSDRSTEMVFSPASQQVELSVGRSYKSLLRQINLYVGRTCVEVPCIYLTPSASCLSLKVPVRTAGNRPAGASQRRLTAACCLPPQ